MYNDIIQHIKQYGGQNNKNWAFEGPKAPKIGVCDKSRENAENRKTLIFHRISTNFFLKWSEFRDELNAAKIKILAIKGKDLEKSSFMMTSYIIKRYA